jgi:hypothetical protein
MVSELSFPILIFPLHKEPPKGFPSFWNRVNPSTLFVRSFPPHGFVCYGRHEHEHGQYVGPVHVQRDRWRQTHAVSTCTAPQATRSLYASSGNCAHYTRKAKGKVAPVLRLHAMNTYRKMAVKLRTHTHTHTHTFSCSTLDGGEWSASRTGRFYLRVKNPRYPLYRGWVGSRPVWLWWRM